MDFQIHHRNKDILIYGKHSIKNCFIRRHNLLEFINIISGTVSFDSIGDFSLVKFLSSKHNTLAQYIITRNLFES